MNMKEGTIMESALDGFAVIFRLAVIVMTTTLLAIGVNDISNTWHDTRIVCQHVTHTTNQKVCR